MVDKKESAKSYTSENIKVLEGLEGVRRQFDVIGISKKVQRRGDILTLSQELKLDYSSLKRAVEEGRILSLFPNLNKSKVNPLSRLKTERDLIKFSKKYDIYNLNTREIYKLVKKWNRDIQINPLVLATPDEHNLIIGSLMGDASIRQRDRNSCFRVSHSIRQIGYVKWKLERLSNFKISEFKENTRKIGTNFIKAIDLSTRTHHAFNYYRDLFYSHGKKVITQRILKQINPKSLAIWICDDGSYSTKQGYIILCTNAYTLEEHKLMKDFFNRRFKLNPFIGFRDKKYYYLRFNQEDSQKLIKIIKPFVPRCMKYKIGEIYGGQ